MCCQIPLQSHCTAVCSFLGTRPGCATIGCTVSVSSEPPVVLLMGRTNCGLSKKTLLRRRRQYISPQIIKFRSGTYCYGFHPVFCRVGIVAAAVMSLCLQFSWFSLRVYAWRRAAVCVIQPIHGGDENKQLDEKHWVSISLRVNWFQKPSETAGTCRTLRPLSFPHLCFLSIGCVYFSMCNPFCFGSAVCCGSHCQALYCFQVQDPDVPQLADSGV